MVFTLLRSNLNQNLRPFCKGPNISYFTQNKINLFALSGMEGSPLPRS